jgi:GNAT superfamily N-acetyltransferase
MSKYNIEKATREELCIIDDGIVEYNSKKVPFTQEPAFIPINRVMKDSEGNVAAGIIALLYCWKCLYVDVLWVKEEHRNEGLGSTLLGEVEKIAKDHGCYMVHLDTFDFQGKDFYIKQGYEVFGQLDNCPPNHTRYFMKKNL